jgi:hypothetical protein
MFIYCILKEAAHKKKKKKKKKIDEKNI